MPRRWTSGRAAGNALVDYHGARVVNPSMPIRRFTTWHLWGVAAGVLGLVANLLADAQGQLSTEQRRADPAAVVEALGRGRYHVGVVTGLAAMFCLLMAAAAWRRDARTRDAWLAEEAIPLAFVTTAAAGLLAYGFKGALAEYLPGGIDDTNFPPAGLYVMYMIDDTAPWSSWIGVEFAAVSSPGWGSRGARLRCGSAC